MNRSIFQIWQFFFIIFLFLIFYLNYPISVVNCVDSTILINNVKHTLKIVTHNKSIFLASNSITDEDARKTFYMVAHQYLSGGFKTGMAKYFLKLNNNLIPFPIESPFSHPNIFLGSFNNSYVNFQLTHKKLFNFKKFTDTDIINSNRFQYICNLLQIYDSELNMLMLNYDNLDLNNQYLLENNDLINSQIKYNI